MDMVEWNRREFLLAAAAPIAAAAIAPHAARAPAAPKPALAADAPLGLAEIAAAMAEGRLASHRLTETYLQRIDALNRRGPALHAVIEINPQALDTASSLDQERSARGARGPLHGVPILIKEHVQTS